MSQTVLDIPRFLFAEPRRNLPGRKGATTPEDRFTLAFSRAYLDQAGRIHRKATRNKLALAREIPVNGYGIADLLAVAWAEVPGVSYPTVEEFCRMVQPRTRAFECKLSHWRQALHQAVRYRFYAHQTFVVLPEAVVEAALSYLETFRKAKVGLWGYGPESGRIQPYFTPRALRPRSPRYALHAVGCVARASRSLPIR